MSAVAEVSELLVRWQELRQQGQRPSPEELCSGCPERAAELRRQIEALRSMEQFLGLGGPAAARARPPQCGSSSADAASFTFVRSLV